MQKGKADYLDGGLGILKYSTLLVILSQNWNSKPKIPKKNLRCAFGMITTLGFHPNVILGMNFSCEDLFLFGFGTTSLRKDHSGHLTIFAEKLLITETILAVPDNIRAIKFQTVKIHNFVYHGSFITNATLNPK
jgi:hypothetical protein